MLIAHFFKKEKCFFRSKPVPLLNFLLIEAAIPWTCSLHDESFLSFWNLPLGVTYEEAFPSIH